MFIIIFSTAEKLMYLQPGVPLQTNSLIKANPLYFAILATKEDKLITLSMSSSQNLARFYISTTYSPPTEANYSNSTNQSYGEILLNHTQIETECAGKAFCHFYLTIYTESEFSVKTTILLMKKDQTSGEIIMLSTGNVYELLLPQVGETLKFYFYPPLNESALILKAVTRDGLFDLKANLINVDENPLISN